ncbi:MAG: hypothetical protein ACRD2W_03170 [Acidimicrobiales bacterium]
MRRPAWAAAVVAAGLVLGACGGGGGGSADVDDPVLDGGPRDEQAIARDANLRISDFPDEWRAAPLPAGSAAVSMANDNAFADCMGRPRPDQVRVATADSDDFSAQDTRRASSSVQVVRTEEIARDDFVALRGDKGAPCLKAQIDAEFARQLGSQAAAETMIERYDLPQFGDESVAFRVQANNVAEGVAVRTYIDLTFVRKGKVQLSGAFINRGIPFPNELERALLQRMVGRA